MEWITERCIVREDSRISWAKIPNSFIRRAGTFETTLPFLCFPSTPGFLLPPGLSSGHPPLYRATSHIPFEHHPTERRVIVSRLFWEPPASAAAVTQGYGVCSDFLSPSWQRFLPCSSLSPLNSSHRFSSPWHRGNLRRRIWFRFECRSRCEGARLWWPSVARYTHICIVFYLLFTLSLWSIDGSCCGAFLMWRVIVGWFEKAVSEADWKRIKRFGLSAVKQEETSDWLLEGGVCGRARFLIFILLLCFLACGVARIRRPEYRGFYLLFALWVQLSVDVSCGRSICNVKGMIGWVDLRIRKLANIRERLVS